MPVDSRAKGARVEREFAALCAEHLGLTRVQRNLEQSRSGGHDIEGIPGWAPEIKARKQAPTPSELSDMWMQCCRQAELVLAKPLLAVKVNLRGWSCYMDASDLAGDVFDKGERISMSFSAWCQVYRASAQYAGSRTTDSCAHRGE